MKRYLISMGIRTVCVLLVFVVHNPVRWGFAVAAVVLPYIAVLFANATDRRTPAPPDSCAVDHRGVGAGSQHRRGPVPPTRSSADGQVLTGLIVTPPKPTEP